MHLVWGGFNQSVINVLLTGKVKYGLVVESNYLCINGSSRERTE